MRRVIAGPDRYQAGERQAAGDGWLDRYERVRSSLDLGADPAPVVPRTRVAYVPSAALPPERPWQKPAIPNMTGTALAYRPPGALEKGGRRAAATGDYEAWSPEG